MLPGCIPSSVKSLPGSISWLTALRALDVSFNAAVALPRELTACRQLTFMAMESNTSFSGVALLHSLRHLVVCFVYRESVAASWTQLTALRKLQLYYMPSVADCSIPVGLGPMIGLREIDIHGAVLDDLPAGPYLSRLESLSLAGCTLRSGVPANLAAATQLRELDLGGQMHLHPQINLSEADVAVLVSMPVLETLGLDKPESIHRSEWESRLTAMQLGRIAQHPAFQSLPARVKFGEPPQSEIHTNLNSGQISMNKLACGKCEAFWQCSMEETLFDCHLMVNV